MRARSCAVVIVQTQAIVLQIRPWSRTSHMVTWLTPGHGRIVTSVKGACRPKSAFLGQYDLFYTCDLLFYRREHEGVHAIRECAPVGLREPLRRRWRHAAAAGYLCDLTARVAAGQHEAAALFALLTHALDLLAAEDGEGRPGPPDLRALVLWYEVHLLRLLGLLPDLATCPHCHPPERAWLRFSLPSGRLLCPHLAKGLPGEATLALHRGVRELFLQLADGTECSAAEPRAGAGGDVLSADGARSNLLLGLSRFLGMFMTFHLEVPSAVRRVTWEMLDTTPARTPAR
jgi:DNA repair protein RecO